MYYQINHTTTYYYNQPVFLQPHLVRLRPRSNGWQKVHLFSLKVDPEPQGISEIVDLDGNNLTKIWFTNATEKLTITIHAEVETFRDNPFNYLLDRSALNIPIDYSQSLANKLAPYLKTYSLTSDPVIIDLAHEIADRVNNNTISFLGELNQTIYHNCTYITRETGAPWFPGITWKKKRGTCRDFAVLFMDICRLMGLATRFVSGYQEGDLDGDNYDLHAWVEVYLPGAGWLGYDPTHGLVVSDRHLALVASTIPEDAAPITGIVTPMRSLLETGKMVESQMKINLSINNI
jgi:transglutaminase-like putative cysteine protease